MSAASNYLELEILDHVLGETARNYTPTSALHVALFAGTASTVLTALESGTNSTSGSGNWGHYEVNAGDYARQAVNFATASGGSAVSFTVIDNVLSLVVSELSLVAVHTKESTPLELGLG